VLCVQTRGIYRETEIDAHSMKRETDRVCVCVCDRERKEGAAESKEGVRMMKTKRG